MMWQDRIIEFGRKKANQFAAHPNNARRHPVRQREALRGSLETIGNIGVIIENRNSGYVIDGHARIEEALFVDENQELAYVLVDLAPHEEAQALASYDFITYLAEYERDNLDSLLRDIQTDDERVMATLSELAENTGLELVSNDTWSDAFGLVPDSDRSPFQQKTFTLHDSQAEVIDRAIKLAHSLGDYVDSLNENSNGNAIARICETFITQNGQS